MECRSDEWSFAVVLKDGSEIMNASNLVYWALSITEGLENMKLNQNTTKKQQTHWHIHTGGGIIFLMLRKGVFLCDFLRK